MDMKTNLLQAVTEALVVSCAGLTVVDDALSCLTVVALTVVAACAHSKSK